MANCKTIVIRHGVSIYLIDYNPNLYTVEEIKNIIVEETKEHDPYEELTEYDCASEFDIEQVTIILPSPSKFKMFRALAQNNNRFAFEV